MEEILEKIAIATGASATIILIIILIPIIAKIILFFLIIDMKRNTDDIFTQNALLKKEVEKLNLQQAETNQLLKQIAYYIDYQNKHTIPELREKEKDLV